MKKIIIATKNQGKANEFKEMLKPLGFEVLTLLDYPEIEDVEETGTTFEENALLKATAISEQFGIPVLADDSGIEIDALEGRPGVYSARYAGEEKNDQMNNKKVLTELGELPFEQRTARFVAAIALAAKGFHCTTRGTVEGKVLFQAEGDNGFGYDPIFWADELEKSFGVCSSEEKNKISHRARALEKMVVELKRLV